MTIFKIILCLSSLLFSLHQAVANDELPPIEFISNMDDELGFDILKKTASFNKMNKDLPGSPIRLFQLLEVQSTEGGTASEASSGILAGATLGIIPIVKNNDIIVTYRLKVNNHTINEYSYTKNVTDVGSLWNQHIRHNFDEETKQWIISTTALFTDELNKDPKFKSFMTEYNFYFGE